MYVPRIPHFNDPYDREWLAIVGIFFIVLVAIGLLNIIMDAFVY